ncbi:UNVERIFIED_CONTAM: protein decapping 5 [Sesamum latifolium]|uniref:Protein decapping 5 n=1 Tax=Sesamum latifolium TaxID=2727402 RepID=A0AAW2X2Z3_9LAMI
MAEEPSTTSSNPAPEPAPSSSSAADSYIGSFISVTSKSEIRYEGVLYYLNPQDSTLGLKNGVEEYWCKCNVARVKSCYKDALVIMRSYGTEGRKKDGPQVPPSDKIYDYILFRGSDIKDLEVKTGTLPAQKEEAIYNDPAIIQSSNHAGPSSARSVLAVSGPSTEFNLHGEPFVSNSRSYPSILSSQHSGNQLGQWSSSPSPHNAISSYDRPTHWQGYRGAPGDIPVAHPHSSSSTTTLYPLRNQESTTMTATNLYIFFSPGHSSATSSSVYFNATPNLSSEQLSTPFTDSISPKVPLQFHHSTLVNSNGLTMPFPLSYQSTSNIEAPTDNRIVPNHVQLPPAESSPHFTPSVSVPLSDPLLRQQPPLLTPNQLTPSKLSEHCPENSFSLDQKHVDDMSSMCLKIPSSISSSAATQAVQPPLLPLPPPSEKLQYSSQLTEEFDFQAMNEKFKKDEVWGYLGKANLRDKIDGARENGTSSQDAGDANNRSVSNDAPRVAYNKDDFFDTISCNSTSRSGRNGQYRSSERMKLDSEVQ